MASTYPRINVAAYDDKDWGALAHQEADAYEHNRRRCQNVCPVANSDIPENHIQCRENQGDDEKDCSNWHSAPPEG